MRDMNIAKLTSADAPLFNAIVQDLFPSTELPVIDYGKVSVPRSSLTLPCEANVFVLPSTGRDLLWDG